MTPRQGDRPNVQISSTALAEPKLTLVRPKPSLRNWFHSLPSVRFQALLTLFPKSFSSFPHGTCLLSVSGQYLALEENYLPFSAPRPKYATLRSHPGCDNSPRERGSHPLWRFFPKKLTQELSLGETLKTTIPKQVLDFHFELFPVQSPLLRESYSFSFPPLTYMLKFSG